jgi:hypothetical protein
VFRDIQDTPDLVYIDYLKKPSSEIACGKIKVVGVGRFFGIKLWYFK